MPVFNKMFDTEGRYYKAAKDVHVNSTIANHTLCGEKNVHKVLIICLWKACPGTIWFGQWRN